MRALNNVHTAKKKGGVVLESEFRKAVAVNRDLVFRVAYTYLRDAADAEAPAHHAGVGFC